MSGSSYPLRTTALSCPRVVFGLFIALALPGMPQEAVIPSPAPAAVALPASPAELFAALAKGVRPQWRSFFRETVSHSAGDRYKAALALGAVDADCYLAADARDAQQIRNLLTDMASLETTLGIARQMSSLRQKPTDLADEGDWPGVRKEVAALMTHHAQFLAEQNDGSLAELEHIGCWLRAFHIGARFSAKQLRPPLQPCIWSSAMLADLHSRAVKLSAGRDLKSLDPLVSGLESLTKTWQGDTTSSNAADRLAATLKLLDSLMAELIDDTPAEAPKAQP